MIDIKIHINGKNTAIYYSDKDMEKLDEEDIKRRIYRRIDEIFNMPILKP